MNVHEEDSYKETINLAEGITKGGGSEFDGWYEEGEEPKKAGDGGAEYTPKESQTLRAKWVYGTKPFFAAHSLALSGTIGVNFYMNLPEADHLDYTDSYMEFAIRHKDGTVKVYPKESERSAEGYYRFTCKVNSIQMADEITATFHYTLDGEPATVAEKYSAEQYIQASAGAAFDEKTMALIHALADYGHYAQVYLAKQNGWTVGTDHAENQLHYTSYTDESAALVKAAVQNQGIKVSRSKQIEKISYSLTLDSDTAINLYFTPSSSYTGTPTAALNGSPVSVQKINGRFKVVIPNIAAHRLGTTYTVCLKTGKGETTVKVSALSYIKDNITSSDQDQVNAMIALYNYYAAAKSYLP